MDAKDGLASTCIGRRDVENTLKATASKQGRVNHFGTVGGRHNDDTVKRFNTVHARKQLIHDTVANIAAFRLLPPLLMEAMDSNSSRKMMMERIAWPS